MLPLLKKLLRYLWHLIPRRIRSLMIPFLNWLDDLSGLEGTFLVSAKRLDEANAKLNEARIQAKVQARTVSEQINYLRKRQEKRQEKFLESLRPYHLIIPKLQKIEDISKKLRADVIIAVSAESLPYAMAAKGEADTPIFCDATEFPALDVRTLVPNWPKSNLKLINMALEGYLYECKGIFTVGWELEKSLKKYGVETRVIPNYRYAEKHCRSNKLREKIGLDENCKIVIAISTIATELKDVLRALGNLPSNFHLVVVGNIVPYSYKQDILDFAEKLDIKNRFWIVDPVPYSELTSFISSADVGLIIRDPSIKNNFVSLPNRVFDYMFAGVPVVAPFMPDIHRVITTNNFGISLEERNPAEWERSILHAQKNRAELQKFALNAAKKLTWENVEEDLLSFIGRPKSVTIIGQKNLLKHNRSIRIAKTLAQNGASVKLALNEMYINDEVLYDESFNIVGF